MTNTACPQCSNDMVDAKATDFGETYKYCRTCRKELKEMQPPAPLAVQYVSMVDCGLPCFIGPLTGTLTQEHYWRSLTPAVGEICNCKTKTWDRVFPVAEAFPNWTLTSAGSIYSTKGLVVVPVPAAKPLQVKGLFSAGVVKPCYQDSTSSTHCFSAYTPGDTCTCTGWTVDDMIDEITRQINNP